MTSIASTTSTTPSDLLRVADLSAEQLNALLDLADEMRDGPGWWKAARQGTAVACVFDTPSERTRAAFEAAASRLGMRPIMLHRDELRLDSLGDTAAIVVRTSAQTTLEELADAASVPVVNAATEAHHPCKALADLLTVRRHFGYLEAIRFAYVGEGSNVAHSLMEAGALAGMHVTVATPPGSDPHRDLTRAAMELAGLHGGSINVMHDAHSAVTNADVVYALGEIDDAVLRAADPQAILLHSQPTGEQTANRLPTAQATLHMLTSRRHHADVY